MTKEEWINYRQERSEVPWNEVLSSGYYAEECHCNKKGCLGWRIVKGEKCETPFYSAMLEEAVSKAKLTFNLPEDESELRAAIDAMEHIAAIRDFYERLHNLNKHGHTFFTVEQAIEKLFVEYCATMENFI
jgi:hypothetical protein